MAVFFTSDTHFGDARRIRIDKRPFANIAEHDAGLIARWNAVVAPDDDVYHLGDFARIDDEAAVTKWLRALNGRKHLIVGNNDSPTVIENETWASVSTYAEIALDGHLLILCHYPFRSWHNSTKGAIDIHGHSHGKMKELPRQYDVGVDVFDYRPVTLAEILASRRRGKKAKIAKVAAKPAKARAKPAKKRAKTTKKTIKKPAKSAKKPIKPAKKRK
ncbi:calcineurin-like phosphoesterase family protein [Methylovirgula ligni]|uniref:Calcineurin-like phosphoesterase family protein n=1 Tax=Methylovirgula ligni TaxID=569860 RepID=A0A3D9YP05_9HYPH|nr:calcineurin-like phosphoesterase family protein [Methylovirgula ligni]